VTAPRPPDTLGMWEAAAALPEQLPRALEEARRAFVGRLPDAASVRAVAAFGLGTAATACEAAAAVATPQLEVPFWIGRGSPVPAFVGSGTLCLAVALGGENPETVLAASEAAARGARVVAIGGADALAPLLAEGDVTWCPVTPDGPAARAAIGAATVPVLVALAEAGLLPDPVPSVTAAAEGLARRSEAFRASGGPAVELARHIGRTIPLVYGSAGVAGVAARWWKERLNVAAKTPAFAAELPALAYGELAGWGQGGDITRQAVTLVLLRHPVEDPGVAGLFAAVRPYVDEVMADVLEVWADGDDDLGRFFDLAFLGELVALHLAAREGVDPGPAPAVDEVHSGAGRLRDGGPAGLRTRGAV
jgi:glucose/mannose-6-phosphate isomerase